MCKIKSYILRCIAFTEYPEPKNRRLTRLIRKAACQINIIDYLDLCNEYSTDEILYKYNSKLPLAGT